MPRQIDEPASSGGTVAVRINPRLWKIDQHTATVDGVEYVFTHEPVDVPAAVYEAAKAFTVRSDDHERQVVTKARDGDDDE